MEKRDAGAGETVKREKGLGLAGLGGAAGTRRAGSWAGVSGRPSSHSNPPPARGPPSFVDRMGETPPTSEVTGPRHVAPPP